jgi:hypothetical protein
MNNASICTASTISGTWTQLGADNIAAGTTSIFSGNAPLEVGTLSVGTIARTAGQVHAVEVRNGIGGTIAAGPDFTDQTVGSTGFGDSTGKTWAIHGTAQILGSTYRSGLRVPFSIPGVLVGGRVELTNTGTADAGLRFRIDGPIAGPRIVLQRPDGSVQSIRWDLNLATGQWLEVDTTAHLALLNGLPQSNQRGRAVWDMDAYPLPPGTSILRFGSADVNALAQVTVSWRSAWW